MSLTGAQLMSPSPLRGRMIARRAGHILLVLQELAEKVMGTFLQNGLAENVGLSL